VEGGKGKREGEKGGREGEGKERMGKGCVMAFGDGRP